MTIDAHDPFDGLRLDDVSVEPGPAFAVELRARLGDELAVQRNAGTHIAGTHIASTHIASTHIDTGATTMTSTHQATSDPTGAADAAGAAEGPATASVTVVPYLTVHDGAAALAFYSGALGAVEDHRMVGDDGRVGHSEFHIGGARFSLSDEYPEMGVIGPQTRGGATCAFQLYVPDVDAAFERAVAHGATAGRPPADQFHGNRTADVVDPFGHRWMLITPLAPMSPDEYDAAGAAQGFVVDRSAAPSGDEEASTQLKHYGQGDLYYFTVGVPDLPKAQAFYGAVLGWQFDDPQAGHVSNIAAPPGGVRPDASMPGTQLWFVVDDIHDAVVAVREHGGTAEEPVNYDSGWSADCVDDQGVAFSLSVPADKYRLP